MVSYHILLTHWLSPCTLLFSTGPQAISTVHYFLLLAQWSSLWYTSIFYWPTGPPYGTRLSSTGPLVVPMVHYHLLRTLPIVHYYLLQGHWLSLWYTTIFYWPIGPPFGTLQSSTCHLAIFMVHLVSSTGTLVITMVHNRLLLTHWLYLWSTTIFYWPNGPLCGTHYLMLVQWLSLWYTTIFYWPTGTPYGTLLSFPGQVAHSYGTLSFSSSSLAVSVVHYYLLLAHCLFLWYTLIFYWPIGPPYCTQQFSTGQLAPIYLCGTLLSSTGPLAISMVHYYLLLAHLLSLWYISTF